MTKGKLIEDIVRLKSFKDDKDKDIYAKQLLELEEEDLVLVKGLVIFENKNAKKSKE